MPTNNDIQDFGGELGNSQTKSVVCRHVGVDTPSNIFKPPRTKNGGAFFWRRKKIAKFLNISTRAVGRIIKFGNIKPKFVFGCAYYSLDKIVEVISTESKKS